DSVLRCSGLQGKRVELVAHPATQRLIDHLMLLDTALSTEGARDDMRRVMIAVAAQVFDRNLRIGQALLDQPLDHRCVHRHPPTLPAKDGPIWPGSKAWLVPLNAPTDMAPAPKSVNEPPPPTPMTWAGTPAANAAASMVSGSGVSIT